MDWLWFLEDLQDAADGESGRDGISNSEELTSSVLPSGIRWRTAISLSVFSNSCRKFRRLMLIGMKVDVGHKLKAHVLFSFHV